MSTTIFTAEIPVLVLCAVPIFGVLFAIILKTLRQMPFLDGSNPIPLAVCVTLLCMIGLHQVFVHPVATEAAAPDDTHRSLDFLLLPYTAMALAMLLALCLLLLDTVARSKVYAKLRAEIIKRRKRLATLKDSPKQALQDGMPRGPSWSRDEGRCGSIEPVNRPKELRTHLQKKEI